MIVAVPTEGEQIFQHFGKSTLFSIYEVDGGQVVSKKIVDATGHGHAALSAFLKGYGVQTVICGGIGGGAIDALGAGGITVYAGNSGNVDVAVMKWMSGELRNDVEATCHHHDHEEGHSCDCKNHCK